MAVVRGVAASLAVAFVASLVLLRILPELVDSRAPEVVRALLVSLVVLLGTAAGGAAGAWQAAAGGAPSRAATVVAGAAGPVVVGSVVSVALGVSYRVSLGDALLEITMILGGAPLGAWLFARRRLEAGEPGAAQRRRATR